MIFAIQPWQLYLTILAGWINRQQQVVIDYLRTENQVLRETHGTKRILLSDDQRRRLAVQGNILGRKLLTEVGTVFTPDTILRWHRQLVAQKWDDSQQRKRQLGRPRVLKVEVEIEIGKPIHLTAEEHRLLAEKADGIDSETHKQIAVIAPGDPMPANPQTDSAELR